MSVVLLLCRDCCCGTTSKHPRTDHDGQQLALESAAADGGVVLRVVDCLDECDRSNVAVVRRPKAPRRERDTWFGGLLTGPATEAMASWLRDGAPEDAVPSRIRGLAFRHVPPRRR